jgi:para-nitrobenzyl esterase
MEPEVETSCGRLRGVHEGGLLKFRGIPFARPPVGELRFRPPQPALPWSGIFDATRFGPAPPQDANDPLPVHNDITDCSEDCLRLNIWTPGLGGKRPVMVWLHGGAFVRGSASRPTYDRAVLACGGDVVLVAVDYRLGALGFLHLEGLCGPDAPFGTNVGIRDQLQALEWIHAEIAAFGGDPDNVTVFGNSAGSVSAGTMLAMPARARKFRRAILQSGPPMAILPEAANPVARALLERLGISATSAEQLRRVPADALLAAQAATWRSPGSRPLDIPFAPVVDGDLLPQHPLVAIAAGSSSDIDLISGTTVDEMRPYLAMQPALLGMDDVELRRRCERILPSPSDAAAEHVVEVYRRARVARGAGATACDLWLAIQGDRFVRFASTKAAELQSELGGRAYSYLFSWQSPFLGGLLGACHELELPFLFGYLDDAIATTLVGERPQREMLAAQLQGAWTAFARGGLPRAATLPEWPSYERARRATMIFDAECLRRDAPLEDERRVWEEILPLGCC